MQTTSLLSTIFRTCYCKVYIVAHCVCIVCSLVAQHTHASVVHVRSVQPADLLPTKAPWRSGGVWLLCAWWARPHTVLAHTANHTKGALSVCGTTGWTRRLEGWRGGLPHTPWSRPAVPLVRELRQAWSGGKPSDARETTANAMPTGRRCQTGRPRGADIFPHRASSRDR